MRKWVLAVVMIAAVPAAVLAADADAGKMVFNKCKACHQAGPGAKNAVGPVLNGIVGRKAGTIADFTYSDAVKNSGVTWDEASIDKWLQGPSKMIPGTKMIFAGVKDDTDRANVIEYLKTLK